MATYFSILKLLCAKPSRQTTHIGHCTPLAVRNVKPRAKKEMLHLKTLVSPFFCV